MLPAHSLASSLQAKLLDKCSCNVQDAASWECQRTSNLGFHAVKTQPLLDSAFQGEQGYKTSAAGSVICSGLVQEATSLA